jgi:hypothetical protein
MSNVRRSAHALAIIVGPKGLLARRSSRATATAFLLALMIGAAPQTASAQSYSGPLILPGGNIVLNPCTNELVALAGTTDLDARQKFDNNGGSHITFHIKHKGTGNIAQPDGTTTSYNFHSAELFQFQGVSPGTSEFTTLTKFMLIRQGSADGRDDFVMKATQHITQHADGSFSSHINYVEPSCLTATP